MARLPQPGGDDGTWGTVLNDFLAQAHNTDGTLKDGSVGPNTLQSGAVTKITVGLGNVDNTSDANKPVSTATQTALDAKVDKSVMSLNVKDYGAKGDGLTDDTTAINNAITALTAGGVLFFPPGRYITSGGHTLSVPCTIIGSGRHQLFNSSSQLYLKNGANADMFTLGASTIELHNIMVYGNATNQTGTSRGVVMSAAQGANYFVLDNVWIDSFNGDGVILQSADTTLSGIMSKCEIRLCNGYGLNVTGTASDIIVSDCYIDQNAQSGAQLNASDVSFNNCHFWGNGTGSSGFRDGVTAQSASGCRFVNCYIESNTNGAGLRMTNTCTGFIIVGCDIWNNGFQGIYGFGSDHVVMNGNRIRKNNFKNQAGNGGVGIYLDTCNSCSIVGNVFGDTGTKRQTYGYSENGTTCSYNVFSGNVSKASDHATGNWIIGAGTNPTIPAVPANFNVG